MKPLKSNEIYGNWASLILPINDDNSIDYNLLAEQIDILISMKVDGIYNNGTTGEFHNQTEEEFDRISELLAEKCNAAGVPFQIGVSHMGSLISIERLKRIISFKPGAVQVILPDWFPVTNDEAIIFLQRMAEIAEPIGLIFYNPPHAKKVLNPEEICRLISSVPSIVGMKGNAGNKDWYEAMKPCARDISIFVPGHLLASQYVLGGNGAYSNMAGLNPLAAQKWYDQMSTNIEAALELERRIRTFMNNHILPFIIEKGYSDTAADKLAAVIGGWTELTPRVRWPYKSIQQSEADGLRPVAKEIIPEFFI